MGGVNSSEAVNSNDKTMAGVQAVSAKPEKTRPATMAGKNPAYASRVGSHIVQVPIEEFSKRDWHMVITCNKCGVKHSRDDLRDRRSDTEYMSVPCSCGGRLEYMPFFTYTAQELHDIDVQFHSIPCPECGRSQKEAQQTYGKMGFYQFRCPCGTDYMTSMGSTTATIVNK